MTHNPKKNYAKFEQENETELDLYFFSIETHAVIVLSLSFMKNGTISKTTFR